VPMLYLQIKSHNQEIFLWRVEACRDDLFLATAGAAPVAHAGTREPVVVDPVLISEMKPQSDPIRIVHTYQFEPREVDQIKAAAANAQVEIVICKTQAGTPRKSGGRGGDLRRR